MILRVGDVYFNLQKTFQAQFSRFHSQVEVSLVEVRGSDSVGASTRSPALTLFGMLPRILCSLSPLQRILAEMDLVVARCRNASG